MARGAALLITDGETESILRGEPELGNTGFPKIGGGRILELPMGIWIMVVFAIVIAIVLRKTPFGRWLYASGGNENAAKTRRRTGEVRHSIRLHDLGILRRDGGSDHVVRARQRSTLAG